jgi:hypothetical protein
MDRRRLLLGLFLVSAFLMRDSARRLEARSTPHLVDVTPAHGVFNGRPVEPTDLFTPDDTPIYVWFRCEGCAIGTVITSSWWYVEPEPPLRFGHGSLTVSTLEDFGEFHCELLSGQRWPIGSYRVELRINGIAAAEVPFRVVVNTQR